MEQSSVDSSKVKMFAIWKYDSFPYILGSEVTELHSNGIVSTTNYGTMRFKYLKLFNLEEGIILMESINKITIDYYNKLNKFKQEELTKVESLIGLEL